MTTPTPATLQALASGDLANATFAATPGGIKKQEAEGQAALAKTDVMPIELRPSRSAFEAVGFSFGDTIDDIFRQATLPDGWCKRPTDHSMHTELVDENGAVRGNIFYKAAFYDRKADANLYQQDA